LIVVSCVAYFNVLKSYMVTLFGAKDLPLSHIAVDNASYWLFLVAVSAFVLMLVNIFSKGNRCLEKKIKLIKDGISYIAVATTTVAAIGCAGVFFYEWKQQGYPYVDLGISSVPKKYATQGTVYLVLAFLGGAIPTLGMSFLNHISVMGIVYENIKVERQAVSVFRSAKFRVIMLSQLIITILYILVPLSVLLTEGADVPGNVLLSMTSKSDYVIPGKIFQACSGIGILGALLIIYTPLLVAKSAELIEHCADVCGKITSKHRIGIHVTVSALASLGCYILTVAIEGGLNLFMGVGGSVSAIPIMFIFPAWTFICSIDSDVIKTLRVGTCKKRLLKMVSYITIFVSLIFLSFGLAWVFKDKILFNELHNDRSSNSNSTSGSLQ